VGAGLIPLFLGLILLFAVFVVGRGILFLERKMAASLLKTEFGPLALKKSDRGPWGEIKSVITAPASWKGVLYFILKLFLAVFSFGVGIGLLSASVTLAFLPLFLLIRRGDALDYYIAQAWNYPLVIIGAVVAGVFLIFVTLHVNNGLSKLHGKLLKAMLEHDRRG
jgi:hypothetical protein